MVSYSIDPDGKVHTTLTTEESARVYAIAGLLIVLSPMLYAGYHVYEFAMQIWQWHALLCLPAAALPAVVVALLLIHSRIFRFIYLASETLAATALAFVYIRHETDAIWAAAAALALLFVGMTISVKWCGS
jgi:hypothetical protein